MEIYGIDVSSYQGKPDWKKAKKSVRFALLRITEKNGIDSSFEHNYKGCKENGIPVGVYKYSYAMNEKDIKVEAEGVVSTLDGRGIDFPVWLDLEWNNQKILAKSVLSAMIKTFRAVIVSAGYKFGIYCNADWYENVIPDDCKAYEFWIARYPYDDTGKVVERLRPSYGVGWQYSSKGKVPGIDGNVDMDVFYKDYTEKSKDTSEKSGMTYEQAVDLVIGIALAEEGYKEKASANGLDSKTANPGSGNYTKYNRDLHNLHPSNMDYPAPWCDAFVDWCFWKAFGADLARKILCGDFDDYTVYSADYYKKAGRWTFSAKRGYQIFFKNSTGICHTGLVYGVKDGRVYTIEGNKGNSVKRCSYTLTDASIAGYGQPKYELVEGLPDKIPAESLKPVESAHSVLRKGSNGEEVKTLQRLLNQHGYDLAVDGEFGRETYKAVLNYQNRHELEADGVVGKYTWKSLELQNFEKDVNELAKEVIAGKWGNGSDRKKRLTAAGYNYEAIQKKVNQLLS